MLFSVDGLDDSMMSASSICNLTSCMYPTGNTLTLLTLAGLADLDTGQDHAVTSGTFWDDSPYPDLAQTWFENDFFAGFGREKVSTLTITSQSFSDAMNSESPSTLFIPQEPLRAGPSVLKQSNFGDDPWRTLTSPVDDAYSPLSAQESGKENMPPQPTLDDFSGSCFWADSPTTKFGTHSPQRPNPRVPDTYVQLSYSPPPLSLPPPTRSQIKPKGLFGWGDTSLLQTPNPISSVLRQRSLSRSSDVGAVLNPHVLTLNSGSPLRKRPRQSPLSSDYSCNKSENLFLDSTDGDGSPDESDLDDYRPSCSPSPKFERFKRLKRMPSSDPTPSPKPAFRTLKRGKMSKIKKAKKKGSAALALALVTHVGEVKREAETLQVSLDPDSFDPVRVYQEGSYVAKKRKNQPIPIPVPVPNLNKKSRGRKVPFVSKQESPFPSSVVAAPIEYNLGSRLQESTRSHKKAQPVSPSDESGSRTYVCVIPGCGKCFVRGEHLKRHVRSIHTNDKRKYFGPIGVVLTYLSPSVAHVCPIEGCHKSFSRRDNLGQHVRVHLQS